MDFLKMLEQPSYNPYCSYLLRPKIELSFFGKGLRKTFKGLVGSVIRNSCEISLMG